jgi:hypothetical protein
VEVIDLSEEVTDYTNSCPDPGILELVHFSYGSVPPQLTEEQNREIRISLLRQYAVEIDFDGASEAWRENKKKLPNGCYSYIHRKKISNEKKYCTKHLKDCNPTTEVIYSTVEIIDLTAEN